MVTDKPKAGGIDYSVLKFGKGTPKAEAKARKNAAEDRAKARVKRHVFDRDRTCRAYGVSPICTRTPWDRHELIPVGRGGEVTNENCVAICRADHRACQNAVGGLTLAFEWAVKDRRQPPDAEAPGHVRAVWRGIWRGVRQTPKGQTA